MDGKIIKCTSIPSLGKEGTNIIYVSRPRRWLKRVKSSVASSEYRCIICALNPKSYTSPDSCWINKDNGFWVTLCNYLYPGYISYFKELKCEYSLIMSSYDRTLKYRNNGGGMFNLKEKDRKTNINN